MPDIRRLSTAEPGFDAQLDGLLAFETAQDPRVEQATAEILEEVRGRGDAALVEFTARFDRWTPKDAAELVVPLQDARAALETLPRPEREALAIAADRIREYHAK